MRKLKRRIPWNKGLTKEIDSRVSVPKPESWKKKMSKIMKGNKNALGHTVSEESKKKISEAHKGMKKPWSKYPVMKGKDNPNWKGGSTIHKQSRGLAEWGRWREHIFKRDDYTCQLCFERCKYLHPHHFMGVTYHKEKRFNKDNGVTLCRECHYLLHANKEMQEVGWYMKGGN